MNGLQPSRIEVEISATSMDSGSGDVGCEDVVNPQIANDIDESGHKSHCQSDNRLCDVGRKTSHMPPEFEMLEAMGEGKAA